MNWNLGNICTYSCSYCSSFCHDGSFPWPKIEEAVKTVKVLDQVYKKSPYNKQKIIFELLGGEVTLWKNIDTLISVIKETNNIIMLVTNGVRTLDWWEKNGQNFEWVTLSYHSEFADYKHICNVSNLLVDLGVTTTVLVLMYPKKWQECVKAHKYFMKNSHAIVSLQRLTLISTSRDGKNMSGKSENNQYPYSGSQLSYFLSENKELPKKTLKLKYDLGIGFFDSKKQQPFFKVNNSFLSVNNLNNWKDWDCYVGIDSLFLEQNGDIRHSVMCRVKPPLGKWRHFKSLKGELGVENLDKIQWPEKPVVCPYTSCFCVNDYRTRKQKVKNNNSIKF